MKKAALFALLAAVLYGISVPVSKLFLEEQIPSALLAGLLYLGAGIGTAVLLGMQKISRRTTQSLGKSDLPFVLAMILLDVAAPICLLYGLSTATAAAASLLGSFEIVATALFAMLLFQEKIALSVWLAIILVTLSSILLSWQNSSGFSFSGGSLLILLACVCWGFENNCTRKLSDKNPLQVVVVKGFGSGTVSLVIALLLGQHLPSLGLLLPALLLGFACYGLSIFFYVSAQRHLGAAKTGVYYAAAPFIGTGLSLLLFRQTPAWTYWVALGILIPGTWLAFSESSDGRKEEI